MSQIAEALDRDICSYQRPRSLKGKGSTRNLTGLSGLQGEMESTCVINGCFSSLRVLCQVPVSVDFLGHDGCPDGLPNLLLAGEGGLDGYPDTMYHCYFAK